MIEGEEDHDGVSVPAGSIRLNGGSIAGAGGVAANLSHNGMGNQDWHRIDGVRPTFDGFERPHGGSDGSDGVYGIGDAIIFVPKFSEDVYARTGTRDRSTPPGTRTGPLAPKLRIKVGNEYGYAITGHWHPHPLTFFYFVKQGDHAPDGPVLEPNSIELKSNLTFRDAAGNPVVSLDHDGFSMDYSNTYGSTLPHFLIDAVRPKVTGIAITSAPDNGQFYTAGETISVTVSFDENMRALPTRGGSQECGQFTDALPQLRIQVGNNSRIADLENISGPEVIFSYAVGTEDRDPDGISIRRNSIVLPCGASLRDDVGIYWGENDAEREHEAIENAAGHAVGTTSRSGTPVDDITGRGLEVSATEVGVAVGGSATYTVKLTAPPTDVVTVTPGVADGTKASVSPSQHVFTQADWNEAQTVTVSGAAAGETAVTHSVSSLDTAFAHAIHPTVRVTVSATGQQGTNPHAELIAQMYEWRNDPQWSSYKAHTDRWDRALLAFGETVADASLTPMTAAEAQALADRGSAWTRWVPVAAALWEIENGPPTVSSAIADVTIVNPTGTEVVSLAGVFSDADNDSLTITATSSNSAVATVSVSGGYSSLTVAARARGTATITVTADDGNGGTVSDSFTVTVKSAPRVASAIGDISGLTAGSAEDVSLSGVFSDADGDAMTISAASSNDAVAEAVLFQDTLTVIGVSAGTATITVTAQDADGNEVGDAFDVTVTAPPLQQQTQQEPYADLIAQMYEWRNDPQWVSYKAHTDRWDRALLAFGEEVSDQTLSPMTAVEAQGYADRGWERWVSVAAALLEIEAAAQEPTPGLVVNVTATPTSHDTISVSWERPASPQTFLRYRMTVIEKSSGRRVALLSIEPSRTGATVSGLDAGTTYTVYMTITDIAEPFHPSATVEVTTLAAPDPPANRPPTVSGAIADVTIVNRTGTEVVSLGRVFSDADGDSLIISAASSDESVATTAVASGYSSLTVSAKSRARPPSR